MRKFLLKVIILLSLLSSTIAIKANVPYDVKVDSWYAQAIDYTVVNNYINLNNSDGYEPDRWVTRNEVAQILSNYFTTDIKFDENIFYDNTYPEPFLDMACTRGEAFYLISKYLEIPTEIEAKSFWLDIQMPKEVFTNSQSYLHSCDCKEYIHQGVYDAIKVLDTYGLIKGFEDETVRWYQPITKAELAQILYNIGGIKNEN